MAAHSGLSSRWFTGASLFASGLVALLVACGATTASKPTQLCTPNDFVFCRCQDRQEGSKLCKDDGASFGPCEPCESFDNPEGPLEPGDPTEPFDPDAGTDARREEPRTCGNGKVEANEDCDDKNSNETDGCDSTCKIAGLTPAPTSSCPGLEVHVWGGGHKPTVTGTTTGSGNRTATPACGSSMGSTPTSGAAGADRVFKVVAHKTGTLNVDVTDTNYNAFIYIAEECAATNIAWATCSNKADGVGNESLTLPVDSGKSYFVFVDGSLPSSLDSSQLQGNYRITFSIP